MMPGRRWSALLVIALVADAVLCLVTGLAQLGGVAPSRVGFLVTVSVVAVVMTAVLAFRHVHLQFHQILSRHPDLTAIYRSTMRRWWIGVILVPLGAALGIAGAMLFENMPVLGLLMFFAGTMIGFSGAALISALDMISMAVWMRGLSDASDTPAFRSQPFGFREAVFVGMLMAIGLPTVMYVSREAAELTVGQILSVLLGVVALTAGGLASHAWWVRRNLSARAAYFRPRGPTPSTWVADGLIAAGLLWAVLGSRVEPFGGWLGLLTVFGGAALSILLAWWLLGRGSGRGMD